MCFVDPPVQPPAEYLSISQLTLIQPISYISSPILMVTTVDQIVKEVKDDLKNKRLEHEASGEHQHVETTAESSGHKGFRLQYPTNKIAKSTLKLCSTAAIHHLPVGH